MSSVTKVFFGRAEVVVTPKLLHELEDIELELVGVDAGESGEGEGPAEEGGTEGNRPVGGVDLLRLTHVVALVGGDDNVGVLNDTLEVLVHGLAIDLEFEDAAIDLVDEQDGLDLLTESLTENSLGLDADTFDVVDDDESAVSDTEGGSDFSGEVDVPGGVDEVDKVGLDFFLVSDVGLEVERYTGRLDGDTTLLFVGAGVGGTHISSLVTGNDTGFGDEGVCEGRLAVIDVGDDGHVTDLIRFTHDFSNLVNCEVWHVCVWSVKVKL